MSLALEVHGLNETIGALERGKDRFPNDVGLRAIQQLTLEARRELQKGMSGATIDRGFWGRGTPYGGQIGVRTGSLRRSISPGLVYRAGSVVTGIVGSPDPRAALLEKGGTVTPKSGKYLRIPTKYVQTPAGVDRNAGRSMRDVPGTSIHRSKAGNLFIWGDVDAGLAAFGGKVPGSTRGAFKGARRAGKKQIPLYMLVTSSEMPAKHVFGDTQLVMRQRAPVVTRGRAEIWLQQVAVAPGASSTL